MVRMGADSGKFSYLICDARSGGLVIQHASSEFEDIFGCDASECHGRKASDVLGTALSPRTLNEVIAARGLTAEQGNDAIKRMSEAVEQTLSSRTGELLPSLLVSVKKSGELFACEMAWCMKRHPVLGWSYHVGLQRDIFREISPGELLEAACDDLSYQEIYRKWNNKASSQGILLLSDKMDSCGDSFDAVAEQVWKDELCKGLKPKESRRAEADTTSIWSRSTASTLASRKDANSVDSSKQKGARSNMPHHFGALLMPTESEREKTTKHADEDTFPHNDLENLDTKDVQSLQSAQSVQSAEYQRSSDGFESISDCEPWQDYNAPSLADSANSADSNLDPLSAFGMTDPIQHVSKSGLCRLKTPVVIAAPTVEGYPIALRSTGFDHLTVSKDVRKGSDFREVLQPSCPRALHEWKVFCETVLAGDFWQTEGKALLGDLELPLTPGELAFVRCLSKPGQPAQCLVYAKQVDLDDCPFLLALCSELSSEGDDASSVKNEFDRLSTEMDHVVSQLACDFFYLAPMRRQNILA